MSDSAPRIASETKLDRTLPLGDAVYRAIREQIRLGGLRPGDRLREEEIGGRYAVSRTPVREAFGRLIGKGLVRPVGGRGLEVRRLEPGEVLELYAMRELLEGAAARFATRFASQVEIGAMAHQLDAFETAMSDPGAMAEHNQRFHEAILQAARNRYLVTALGELQDGIALLGPTTFTARNRPQTAADEHRRILAAISARDEEQADGVAREHIRAALAARLTL